jgi:hypothetical protein
MSIVGVMIVAGGGFAVIDGLVLRLGGRGTSASVGRRLVAALTTLVFELVLTAWLMRWI